MFKYRPVSLKNLAHRYSLRDNKYVSPPAPLLLPRSDKYPHVCLALARLDVRQLFT